MKTPEEILYEHTNLLGTFNTSIIKAMEEYAYVKAEHAFKAGQRRSLTNFELYWHEQLLKDEETNQRRKA
jgi:hypothetical protein